MPKRSLVSLFLILAGCSSEAKLKVTSVEDVQPEITRVATTLEPTRAAEFRTAAEVLGLHAAQSATSEEAQKLSPVTALNGKTPAEIIAEYKKLDPEFRRKTGAAISAVRELKAGNDHLGRALERYKELEAMEEMHPGIFYAIGHVSSIHLDKQKLEGRTDAAKWYEQELSQTPEKLIEKFGGERGSALVEESHRALKAAGK